MDSEVITTEELHLTYRVVARMRDEFSTDSVENHALAIAEEFLRIAYRRRTSHDPIPGQFQLPA